MPHHTSLIAMLCIGFVLAFIFGLLAHRLRFSPIVGYLLAGVLVGPYTPGFVGDETLAPQLAEIGVILLMFGVGLHFSMRDLMDVRRIAVPGAIVQMAAATAMGWFLGTRLGWSNAESLIFGLSLSVASTVVLLRALETARLLDSERGRIAIGWLIVEDLAMVLALVLVPAFAANGGANTGGIGTALLMTLLKVGGFVALMLLVGRRMLPWLLERVAGTGSRELFTLFVLACAMGIAFGAAELFGVSFALGAFFAGMLLNESPFGHKAAEDSLPLRDAFAVLFFVSVGMLFDPMILVRHPLMVLETLGIIVIGKSLAAWAVVRMLGKNNDIALTIAASLAQIGEFSFILIGLGASLGLMSDESRDLILAGAILSILINPPLFALMTRRTRKPETAPTATRPPKGHVLLIGYGRVGIKLAEVLQRAGVPFMVIDTDGDKVINARSAGYTAIRGNAADDAVLAEAMPGEAALAVLTIPDPLEAGKVAQRLKQGATPIPVLARAHSDEAVKHLLQRGADAALLAEHALAHSLGEMITAMPQYRSGPLRSAAG